MDTHHYIRLCTDLLYTTTYKVIDIYNSNLLFANLRQLLNKFGLLNNSDFGLTRLARSLLQLQHSPKLRLAPFYILPKLHKNPVVGRPIVSSPNTPTYHASKYLSNILKPILQHYSHISKSNNDIIKFAATNRRLPISSVIMTADVKSLYPSIPIRRGTDCVMTIMRRHAIDFQWTDHYLDFIKSLMLWVLESNYCEFNNKTYLKL